MTDYYVSVGEREYRVKIERDGLTVDGERLDVSLTSLNGSGMQLMRRNQQAVEMYFSSRDGTSFQVQVEGLLVQAHVRSKAARRKPARQNAQHGALSAPMPGLVVEVSVQEGALVEKGQQLAVVESMKMQMQMRTTVAGVVSRVAVKAGEQVQKGQLLVQVTPADETRQADGTSEDIE